MRVRQSIERIADLLAPGNGGRGWGTLAVHHLAVVSGSEIQPRPSGFRLNLLVATSATLSPDVHLTAVEMWRRHKTLCPAPPPHSLSPFRMASRTRIRNALEAVVCSKNNAVNLSYSLGVSAV